MQFVILRRHDAKSILAMRPFHVSALLVQPHSHMRTGGGSTRRSLSYVCRISSTRPAAMYSQHAMHCAVAALMHAQGTCYNTRTLACNSQTGVEDMQDSNQLVFFYNTPLNSELQIIQGNYAALRVGGVPVGGPRFMVSLREQT